MAERLYLYPLWLRVWHAFNAIFILVLIVTGVSMQFSDPAYPFISFKTSVTLHNIAGVGLTIAYAFYFIVHRFSANRKFYRIEWIGFGERIMKQTRYYLYGIFNGESCPFPVNKDSKFNPLQKVAYLVTMFMVVPCLIITGLALLFPESIIDNVGGVGGTLLTALLHTVCGFFVAMFLVIHLYFCTMGTTYVSNFKSMINGWHE
jgi:thiosulfate reductase cytochrome b subunit